MFKRKSQDLVLFCALIGAQRPQNQPMHLLGPGVVIDVLWEYDLLLNLTCRFYVRIAICILIESPQMRFHLLFVFLVISAFEVYADLSCCFRRYYIGLLVQELLTKGLVMFAIFLMLWKYLGFFFSVFEVLFGFDLAYRAINISCLAQFFSFIVIRSVILLQIIHKIFSIFFESRHFAQKATNNFSLVIIEVKITFLRRLIITHHRRICRCHGNLLKLHWPNSIAMYRFQYLLFKGVYI